MAHKDQIMMLKAKDTESERSAFERFEHELKNTIFGVTFIMLKTELESTWQLLAILFIQACQLFSLVFNPSVDFPWRGYIVSTYFQDFLQAFQIAYWCTFIKWVPYLIIFYTAIGIVVLIVIDIFYAVYTFTNKKIAAMWPLRLLRYALFLLVTIFFMPFACIPILMFTPSLDLFLSMTQCKYVNGTLVHYTFEDVACWKDLHILHAILGIVACAVFVGISLVVVLTLFETKAVSNDPAARIHSRNDFWENAFKFVGILLTTFFTQDEYRWVITLYMLGGSALLFFKARNEKPYYQEMMNKITDVINGLFVWACVCLVIVMISDSSDFNGGMQAFIMAVPMIGVIVVTKTSRRYYILLKVIDDFDNPDEWFLKIRYYIELVQHKEVSREAAVQLNGFIFHHEESCNNVNCPIKSYTNGLLQSLKDKKKKQQKSSTESFSLLMSYAKQLFAIGVAKFPTNSSLHIAYALFMKDRLNDKSTAISEFTAAEKSNPQFDEQFLIYRYRRMLEDETMEVNEGGAASMDVVTMLAYENCLQQCKEAIEKAAYLHMEFWLELLEPEPDLGKLDATGIRISSTIAAVQEHWGKVRKINPNVPKALKLYADYLIEILNDTEEGTELLAKAKDNEVSKNNYLSNVVGDAATLGMGDICATMGGADGTPCMVASGEQGKLGEILQFNMSACRLFGYTKLELLGKKVNMLMPDLYAKTHDAVLQHGIENVEALGLNSSKSEKFVLGRHKSGYLLPLPLQARVVISINQGVFFVATFKSDRKGLNVTYLLLNEQQDIVGVSSRAIESLNLNNHILRNYRVSIQTLAPSIQDKTMATQYQSKNGGNIEFFKPDLSGEQQNGAVTTLSKVGESAVQAEAPGKKLRIKASKKSVKMNCMMTEVSYAGHANGYIIRLEQIEDMKVSLGSLKQDKSQVNFQFAFDPLEMKYIQQNCDEDAQKLIADEMSGYVNIMRDRSASSISPMKSDESKDRTNTSAISGFQEPAKGDDISRLQAALEAKRKAYVEGVETYRLVDGRREKVNAAKSRLLERQQEEQREFEELNTKEGPGQTKHEDAFSALKSRKIFASTLNDRTTPIAVRNLRYAGYAIILVLLAIASTEFGIAVSTYKEIGENIDMIRDNYRQIVSQMTMVFYVSKLVLLQQNGTLTSAATQDCQDRINTALSEYYNMQSLVSLSTLSMSSDHSALFKTKCVYLYYINSSTESSSDKYYTLTEAVQQMASEVFTVQSISSSAKYTANNDDIYFILYNGFSDLYTKLKSSANYYVKELTDRGSFKSKICIALFAVAMAILVISVSVLFPIVASVSRTRLSVLTLFFDLPLATVRELQKKCERFVAQSKDEDVEGMSASESGSCLVDAPARTETSIAVGSTQGSTHRRRYKNNKTSNAAFYIYFVGAILVLSTYFAVNFAFGYIYLKNVNGYSREMNATAISHSENVHAISIMQGLLGYQRIFTLTSSETFDYLALKEITDLYAIAQEMQISHNENAKIFGDSYQSAFIDIMRNNLCNYASQLGLISNCESFLEGTTKEGLHPVLVNFIESMREILSSYKVIADKNTTAAAKSSEVTLKLLSSEDFSDMETSIFDVADPALRYLVDELSSSHDDRYSSDVRQRVILYVCFLFGLLLGYFALWSPFTDRLSNEVIPSATPQ